MKNLKEFASLVSSIISLELSKLNYVATKKKSNGDLVSVQFPVHLMPDAEKKVTSKDDIFYNENADNFWYEFSHVDALINTKEENEQIGKESARLDGLYDGELDLSLLESAKNKHLQRIAGEEIYEYLQSQLRITANYHPQSDTYNAFIQKGSTTHVLKEENGSDLVDSVKKETGIEIEYDSNSRKFNIPQKNRFDA